MIYFYNTKQSYEAIALYKKQYKKENIFFTDIFSFPEFLSASSDISLFQETKYFFFDINSFSSENLQKEYFEMAEKSENIFLIYVKNLSIKEKIEEFGYKIFEEKIPFKKDFPKDFVNALQRKDKKQAWILFLKEKEKSYIEEVFGVVNFAYKTMIFAISMKTYQENLSIKEFQYRQTKQNIKDRDKDEILESYYKLINLYAISRRKNISLEVLLEQFILSL